METNAKHTTRTSLGLDKNRAFEQIQTIYGTFVTVPGDVVSEQLRQYSAHTRNELAMLRSLLRANDVVLDIGAHIGTFAIPIAMACQRSVRVFAFEPQPDVYALLERNVMLNGLDAQISLSCGIVFDRPQSFQRLAHQGLPPRRPSITANTGGTAFVPTTEPGAPDHEGPQVFVIDAMIRAGALPARIDLVKVDTEGAELAGLRSCADLIGRELPVLYVEINAAALQRFNTSVDDIDRFLHAFGYHYFRNIGKRNSDNDSYRIARIRRLVEGGNWFDLLAVHPRDPRYPRSHETYNRWESRTRGVQRGQHGDGKELDRPPASQFRSTAQGT
jgi:FkbM family methyltransferase